jgi:hypothetical protein
MKFNKNLIIVVFCAFSIAMVSVTLGTAQEEKETVTITGTVLQSDSGLVILTDGGMYSLSGQDLSKMVDKEVEVSGTVTEGDEGSSINMTSFREIQG